MNGSLCRRAPRLFGLALLLVSAALCAETRATDAEAVGEAQEAFRNSATFPWYDASKDSLAPLELRTEPEQRRQLSLPWLKWVAWGLLGAGLLLLAVLIVVSIRNFRSTATPVQQAAGEVLLESEGVEALPFMARRSRDDLLGEARRLYELGSYSEAIVYLFSYELVQLDRFSVIRLARGKTNRQYVRECAKLPPHRQLLERTMLAFEDVFFGGRVLDRAGFEACWQHVASFESISAPSTA